MTRAIIEKPFHQNHSSVYYVIKCESRSVISKVHSECCLMLCYGITEIRGRSLHLLLRLSANIFKYRVQLPIMRFYYFSFYCITFFTVMNYFVTWQLFHLNVTSFCNKEADCLYLAITNPPHYYYIAHIVFL